MKIIGRIDKADFLELELQDIDIKIDTGAYTSSIHSSDIIEVTNLNGDKHIEFKLLDPSHNEFKEKVFRVKNYQQIAVKSSFGDVEKRFIIKTKIYIFEKKYSITLSLSERNDMKFPILLGRKFLSKKFIVNTALKNISYNLKIKKIKKSIKVK